MKLKKGTISTCCWDPKIEAETRVPQPGLLSPHFGIHKEAKTEMWKVTHLNTGMVAMQFDTLKWARHAVDLLETRPAPLPWADLNLNNLGRVTENLGVIERIKMEAAK